MQDLSDAVCVGRNFAILANGDYKQLNPTPVVPTERKLILPADGDEILVQTATQVTVLHVGENGEETTEIISL